MDKNTFWKKLQNYAKKYMNQRQSLLFRYAQVCINCTKLGRKSIKIECHHRLKHFKLSDSYSFAFICFPLHPLFPYVVFLKNIFRAMLFFLSCFVFYSLCDKYCLLVMKITHKFSGMISGEIENVSKMTEKYWNYQVLGHNFWKWNKLLEIWHSFNFCMFLAIFLVVVGAWSCLVPSLTLKVFKMHLFTSIDLHTLRQPSPSFDDKN